jgi:hypothetical protein
MRLRLKAQMVRLPACWTVIQTKFIMIKAATVKKDGGGVAYNVVENLDDGLADGEVVAHAEGEDDIVKPTGDVGKREGEGNGFGDDSRAVFGFLGDTRVVSGTRIGGSTNRYNELRRRGGVHVWKVDGTSDRPAEVLRLKDASVYSGGFPTANRGNSDTSSSSTVRPYPLSSIPTTISNKSSAPLPIHFHQTNKPTTNRKKR